MSKKLLILVAALLLAFPASVMAVPGDGLGGTKHDFTQATGQSCTECHSGRSLGDIGLCTACHTPHKALQTKLLWNHKLSSNSFTWDTSRTAGGTTFPTISTAYSGPTKLCLGCHDGSVTLGDINWYNGGKPNINGMTMDKAPKYQIGAGGSLAKNHPVAFPYPLNNAVNTYNGVQTAAGVIRDEFSADPTAQGIRLYNDNGTGDISGGAVAGKTGIECSSCHDPHNKKATGVYFLRGSNTWSAGGSTTYICTKCHTKD